MSEQDQLDLEPPRAYAKPRWGDYHPDGPAGLLAAWRARRLLNGALRHLAANHPSKAGQLILEARGLAGVEVECERVGLRWRLTPSDLAQRVMFAGGSFEHPLVMWIASQLRQGDRVADIGAHVGLFTTQFAHRLEALGGGAVVSFEPAPDSATKVNAHVAMNGLDDLVTVVEAAVGAEPGRASLRVAEVAEPDDPSRRSIFGEGDTVAANVEVIRFDDWWDYAGRPAIDVVKVDVEGAELGVVEGMRTALTTARPRLMVVEIKEKLSALAGVNANRVVEVLADLGYERRGAFSEVIGHAPMAYLDDNVVFMPKG